MSKLVLIDAMAILHRAYHALPQTLTTRSGKPINAVYGFVSMLLRIINDLEPTHIAICFDRKEKTFRKKEFKDYQSHRPEVHEDLSSQFEKAKDVASAMDIPIYSKAGYEADDIIGTVAKKAISYQPSAVGKKKNIKAKVRSQKAVDSVVIVTGDKDILQLVTKKVKVYLPKRGLSDAQLMGEEEVEKMLGVKPAQIVDYKALVGDPSDNYKGVPGIGPKTAISLLSKYKSKEGIYESLDRVSVREKLESGKESADMSHKLAKIVTDVDLNFDIEKMNKWSVGNNETIKLFESYGFKTLTKRIKDVGKKMGEENQLKLV
jgi:DNA polymerase-1